jgi:hypothetical protein
MAQKADILIREMQKPIDFNIFFVVRAPKSTNLCQFTAVSQNKVFSLSHKFPIVGSEIFAGATEK